MARVLCTDRRRGASAAQGIVELTALMIDVRHSGLVRRAEGSLRIAVGRISYRYWQTSYRYWPNFVPLLANLVPLLANFVPFVARPPAPFCVPRGGSGVAVLCVRIDAFARGHGGLPEPMQARRT